MIATFLRQELWTSRTATSRTHNVYERNTRYHWEQVLIWSGVLYLKRELSTPTSSKTRTSQGRARKECFDTFPSQGLRLPWRCCFSTVQRSAPFFCFCTSTIEPKSWKWFDTQGLFSSLAITLIRLKPGDIFLWENIKRHVFLDGTDTIAELKSQIRAAIASISYTTLRKVVNTK